MNVFQRATLFLFFFSINFEVWDPFQTNGFFSISKLAGFIYLLAMAPYILSAVTRKEVRPVIRLAWLFFALLTMVNLFNRNSSMGNFFDVTIFQNIALLWILCVHEDNEPMVLEKAMLSFAIGSVVLVGLFYANIGITYSADGRISIFGDNQNTIGIRMCIAMIILVMAVVQNPLGFGSQRIYLLIPLPFMLHLMALSASRVAIVSFIIAFVVGMILLKSGTPFRKILALIVSLAILVLVWKSVMGTEVFKLRFLQSIQEYDLSGREVIWQRIFPLIRSNPLFGVGRVGYNQFVMNAFGEIKSPHNVFLEILCYTGITGMVIYSLFLWQITRIAFKVYRTEDLLLPIMLLVPVLGVLLSGQILSVKIGWIIYAYVCTKILHDKNSLQTS